MFDEIIILYINNEEIVILSHCLRLGSETVAYTVCSYQLII